MSQATDITLQCPIPLSRYPTVQLAHGGGGGLSRQLVEEMLKPALGNEWLDPLHDGAVLELPDSCRTAVTTDSFVVRPLFFPGGDIGKLAVYGTVNDLSMCGAEPAYLTLGLILEEGFSMETLWQVMLSIREAAAATGVHIVTGDTKVVDKGCGDGVYINTAGVGIVRNSFPTPDCVKPDDVVVISGDIGRHGIAILAEREGLSFESTVESDCAPLHGLVADLFDAGVVPHALRDLTRGGLATALVELAAAGGCEIELEGASIAVQPEVRGACELLGLDPLYVANEGRMVAVVPLEQARDTLEVMKRVHPQASVIGKVRASEQAGLNLRNDFGTLRRLDLLSGEQLPRIC